MLVKSTIFGILPNFELSNIKNQKRDRKTESAIRFDVKNCTYNTKIITIRETRFFEMFATLFSKGRFLQKAALICLPITKDLALIP